MEKAVDTFFYCLFKLALAAMVSGALCNAIPGKELSSFIGGFTASLVLVLIRRKPDEGM